MGLHSTVFGDATRFIIHPKLVGQGTVISHILHSSVYALVRYFTPGRTFGSLTLPDDLLFLNDENLTKRLGAR